MAKLTITVKTNRRTDAIKNLVYTVPEKNFILQIFKQGGQHLVNVVREVHVG